MEKRIKVEVKNLYKIFGNRPELAWELIDEGKSRTEIHDQTGQLVAVRDVSFEIQSGEIFVIMGLSGSGKSTLIRCLNRIIDPTAGEVYINGENITQLATKQMRAIRRDQIAMVFQNFALFPHRTVWENVAYGLKMQGIDREERKLKAYETLALVGLKGWEEYYPEQLSGGMQQRVGLARALATDADILLMDEAFSALDPLIRAEMQNELLNLQQKLKKTIVFITHDLSEALKIGERIAVMRDGEVVQIATPEELLRSPADEYVASFVKDIDRSQVVTAQSVMIEPETIVSPKSGPRVALHKMKELNLSSVFVVDQDHHLEGIVTVDQAVQAVNNNEDSLEPFIQKDIPKVSPDTTLNELIPMAAEAKGPIAVVNEQNILLGIIVRVSVLAGLAEAKDVNSTSKATKEEIK